MAKYILQKAVTPDKVKKGLLKPLNTYEQQAKRDGCCALLRFENGTYMGCKSRTGEDYISMDPVGRSIQEWAYNAFSEGLNGVVIGEAWWPGKDQFNLISGEFRRGKESLKLQLVINDFIPLNDFNAGKSSVPYAERVADWKRVQEEQFYFTPYWPAGSSDAQEKCNQLVALGGHDGLILRASEGIWTAGRGTTGEIIKIKQVLSFDLRVLEVNTVTGAKTGRDVHKLVVDFNGLRLGVGSGVPHDIADCPTVGQIVEVEAMDYSSDGLLREPRFKAIRYDKVEPDYERRVQAGKKAH